MKHTKLMLGLERTTRALKLANDALERRVKKPVILESQTARGVLFEIKLLPRPLPPHTFSVRRSGVEVKAVNVFDHPASIIEGWEIAKLTYDGLLESAPPPRAQEGTVINAVAVSLDDSWPLVVEAQLT